MNKFRLNVDTGKVGIDRAFKQYIETLKDGQYIISVKKQNKERSTNQNAYYFGVVVAMIAKEIGYTPSETHEALKHKFLIYEGDLLKIKSTTELSTIEFEEFLTKVRVFSAEYLNIYIPLPHETDTPNNYNYY